MAGIWEKLEQDRLMGLASSNSLMFLKCQWTPWPIIDLYFKGQTFLYVTSLALMSLFVTNIFEKYKKMHAISLSES